MRTESKIPQQKIIDIYKDFTIANFDGIMEKMQSLVEWLNFWDNRFINSPLPEITDEQLIQLKQLPPISKIAFCLHSANKIAHWFKSDKNIYNTFMQLKQKCINTLFKPKFKGKYNINYCTDIGESKDPLLIINVPYLQQFSVHDPVLPKKDPNYQSLLQPDSWRNRNLVSQQNTTILHTQKDKKSPRETMCEIINLAIECKTIMEQISILEQSDIPKYTTKYKTKMLELQAQLNGPINKINYMGANIELYRIFDFYIEKCSFSELDIRKKLFEAPKNLQTKEEKALKTLIILTETMGLPIYKFDELETTLSKDVKNIIDFSDQSNDTLFGIDTLPENEKRLSRILLNLKFIKQQYPEQYQSFITKHNIDFMEADGISFEEAIFDKAFANQTTILNSESNNPIISYIKEDILEIPEISEEKIDLADSIIQKVLTSGEITNNMLASIKLKNMDVIEGGYGKFNKKRLNDIKRVTILKTSIQNSKYSEEQKLFLMSRLKHFAEQNINIDAVLFNQLQFEDDPKDKIENWNKYLNLLETQVDQADLEQAAQTFFSLEKMREGEVK